MKNRICSIEHFKNLQKFFRKVARKQLIKHEAPPEDNERAARKKLLQLFLYDFLEDYIKEFEDKLLNVFKGHPYKTHSSFCDKFDSNHLDDRVEMYVSYTVENENFRRCGISSEAYIAFRIFMKVGNRRKHRVARCRVKLSWIPIKETYVTPKSLDYFDPANLYSPVNT